MNVNNFGPFDPTIWGTVSDWITVVVTGLTGYLIYATLKSQIKVQNLQQEVTAIAVYSHKQSILPIFTFEKPIVKTKIESKKIIFEEIRCKVILEKNIAKNIKYSVLPSSSKRNGIYQQEFASYMPVGKPFEIYWQHEIDIPGKLELKYSYNITFTCTIYFEDIDGNKYQQVCLVNLNNQESTLIVHNPLPLSI